MLHTMLLIRNPKIDEREILTTLRRAFADVAFHPNFPAVLLNQFAAENQPQARSFFPRSSGVTVARVEFQQFRQDARRNADAGVGDADFHFLL